MLFDSLGNKLSNIFQKLRLKGKIRASDLEEVLRNIRIALLEADVNIRIATTIIEDIKKNAVGVEIIEGVSASEMIIKLTNDALKKILGDEDSHGYKIDKDAVNHIMIVGLQGSGKTTTVAKLANFIREKTKKSPLVSSLDFYRPAARDQLKILCQQNHLDFYEYDGWFTTPHKSVIENAKEEIKYLEKNPNNNAIFDTAGRTSINEEMMEELVELKKIINPTHIILVVDSMLGKSSIDVAKHFHEKLTLTGLIFTKADSDAKAGAILSIRQTMDLPIHFLCSGEKINDIDEFHTERIANRILGMGDIVSLVEKASAIIDDKDSDKLKAKAAKGELDLMDVLEQFKFLKKMGGLPFVSKFLPVEMVNSANISESKVKHFEAIILSMTRKERLKPQIVMQSSSRKERIGKGSGTSSKLVHELLMMHAKISKVAQQFASFDKGNLMDKFKLGNALGDLGKK